MPVALYSFEGLGHSAWNAEVDGQSLAELAFEFITQQQRLNVVG